MIKINGKLFDWDAKKNLANIEKHGVSLRKPNRIEKEIYGGDF